MGFIHSSFKIPWLDFVMHHHKHTQARANAEFGRSTCFVRGVGLRRHYVPPCFPLYSCGAVV